MAGVGDFEVTDRAWDIQVSSMTRGAGKARVQILKRSSGGSWRKAWNEGDIESILCVVWWKTTVLIVGMMKVGGCVCSGVKAALVLCHLSKPQALCKADRKAFWVCEQCNASKMGNKQWRSAELNLHWEREAMSWKQYRIWHQLMQIPQFGTRKLSSTYRLQYFIEQLFRHWSHFVLFSQKVLRTFRERNFQIESCIAYKQDM